MDWCLLGDLMEESNWVTMILCLLYVQTGSCVWRSSAIKWKSPHVSVFLERVPGSHGFVRPQLQVACVTFPRPTCRRCPSSYLRCLCAPVTQSHRRRYQRLTEDAVWKKSPHHLVWTYFTFIYLTNVQLWRKSTQILFKLALEYFTGSNRGKKALISACPCDLNEDENTSPLQQTAVVHLCVSLSLSSSLNVTPAPTHPIICPSLCCFPPICRCRH